MNRLKQGEISRELDAESLEQDVIRALKNIFDPELPVNIYDLGLIYQLDVHPDGRVYIEMTLTAPGCPVAQSFPGMVECRVREVEGVSDVHVKLVWDPPWSKERVPEAVRLMMGLM